MNVSIIIPVFNKVNFTKSLLRDLAKLPPDHEVIIVDDYSSDATIKLDNPSQLDWELPANFIYLRNKENLRFARSVNRGYAVASGSFILFLNNDVRVRGSYGDWTDALMKSASDGSLVSPTGGLLDDNLNFVCETNKYHDSKLFYLSGWCLMGQRETFEKLKLENGPFEESFIHYFEDTDLSYRARKAGIEMKVVDIPLVHFKRITGRELGLHNLYSTARGKFVKKWQDKI